MLTDPEGHGSSARVVAALRIGVVELGPGVAGQVGAACHQGRDLVANGVEGPVGGLAGGDLLAGSRPGGQLGLPARVAPARPYRFPLVSVSRPGGQALLPGFWRASWPRGMACRYMSRTSSGTQKVSSGGKPRISLVALTSSSPSGEPWALGLSVMCGAGQPMWLRRMSRLGRSSTAMARRKPASRASVSLATSPRRSTCQP